MIRLLTGLRPRVLAFSRPLTLSLASGLLLLDLAVILYGVFTRYVFGGAPIWTDELARFLIIGSVMLAAGAVWVEGGHMRVALIERLLPARGVRLLLFYQWLLTLLLAAAGALFSYRYALSVAMFTTSGLGISRTVPLLALPLGFALLTWQVLWHGPHPLPTQTAPEEAA